MRIQRNVFLILTVGFTFAYILLFSKQSSFIINEIAKHSHSFLVDTLACRIPKLDPFDQSISDYIKHFGVIKCSGKPSITYQEGDMLHINWTVVRTIYKNINYCYFRPIIRRNNSDAGFQYGTLKTKFDKGVKMSQEFIRVDCVNKSGNSLYANVHAFVLTKEAIEKRCDVNLNRHLLNNNPQMVTNVLIVGLDSVSRLNFMRQLPSTRQYLLEELGAIEMLGYTKVADNTLVNTVPLMAGKFLEELPWNEIMRKKPFDEYNVIWKNFSSSGYRTMTAEDHPSIQAFNYLKEGFHTPPTDYYLRPFSFAMEFNKSLWNNNHHCLGDRLEIDIVLQYTLDFAKLHRIRPHFAFTFLTRLSHDSANVAGGADDPFLRFFERMKKENLLDNTVVIFISDHGMRYGSIRNTYIGKFEERMPYLSFVLPKWFSAKYPQLFRNMIINSKRLTTPFDVYETLKGLLYFRGRIDIVNTRQRGISLFNEIPRDRSCADAAILPHWCTCLERESLPVKSVPAMLAANVILDAINLKISSYQDKCENLVIGDIQNVDKMLPKEEVLRFLSSKNDVINRTVYYGDETEAVILIQVTLVTKPGDAIFEATVKYQEKSETMTLAGDISRLNLHGDQSKCIDNFVAKKFCFCK